MRMSGKLQIHCMTSRLVRKIGFVRQQRHHFAGWNIFQRGAQIREPGQNVVHSRQPDSLPIVLQGQRIVPQYRNPPRLQRFAHKPGVAVAVVVSQHRIRAQPGPQRLQ